MTHQAGAPLIIDTRFFGPLPKAEFRSVCCRCSQPRAMWAMGPEDNHSPVCSLCFIYDSQWGRERMRDLQLIVTGIETDCGESFLRDGGGVRLLSSKDGDKVIGILAWASHAFLEQAKKERDARARDSRN